MKNPVPFLILRVTSMWTAQECKRNLSTVKTSIAPVQIKPGKIIFCFLCFWMFPVSAQTPVIRHYAMENKSDFRATFIQDFENVSYVDGGVSGRCFKVIVPENHPKKGFTVHSGDRQYTSLPEKITISANLKGRGRVALGFIVYNRAGKIYWITQAPGSSSGIMEINSPDRWIKTSFTFRPSPENVLEITGFLTSISVKAGSNLLVDDVKTELYSRPVKSAETAIK